MFIQNEQAFPNQDKWTQHQRENGWQAWARLGFPTKKLEDWKYTSTHALSQMNFTLPTKKDAIVDSAPYLIADTFTVIIENGQWRTLNDDALPNGVVLIPLTEAFTEQSALLQAHLGSCLDVNAHGFAALNIAMMQQGLVLYIPNGVLVHKPIHLISINSENKTANITRNLIVLGEHTSATVIETCVSSENNETFTNTVTEIIAERGAKISYTKRILENTQSYHFGMTAVHLFEQAEFDAHSYAISGGWVRSDVDVRLLGPYASTRLMGLYQVDGRRHLDHHTRIDHAVGQCSSQQHYRGVINDAGHAVFNGKILVREYATQTQADQVNKNILLSKNAMVDTKPQLEIFNDDVRCTHGTTVGQLDEEALFYLRARGVPLEDARRMLLQGFSNEITKSISFMPLQRCIEAALVIAP